MSKYFKIALLLITAISYSQNQFPTGTYITSTKGQDIKLNLKANNQYEVVIFHGDYQIKNDTLYLDNNHQDTADFSVAFSSEANPKLGKVKVKITGSYLGYYNTGLYIGTQNGNSQPNFKTLSQLLNSEIDFESKELEFEMDRSEFFYLVKDEFDNETTASKYSLPKTANQIEIEYEPNFYGRVKLIGYLNDKQEIVITEESKKSPLIFIPEDKKPKVKASEIKPIEIKKEKNWTFPGKENGLYGLDEPHVATNPKFQLIVQDNLVKALEATKKTPKKILVINYDVNNKNTKADFDSFIKKQQAEVDLYNSYEYNEDYDKYNYYQATSKDKTWFEKNKIKNEASVITVDSEGNILSQTKGNIMENQELFNTYYSSLYESLKRVKVFFDFKKVLNSKAKDSEILNSFYQISQLEPVYDDSTLYPTLAAPVEIENSTEEEAVKGDEVIEEVPYKEPNKSEISEPKFEKGKVLTAWDGLIKAHSKDSKPDMQLVSVITKEIQNNGFYKQLFGEERLFDETNFKAIDYLLKHYEAIVENQNQMDTTAVASYYGSFESDISNALYNNANFANDKKADSQYQKRLLGLFRNLSQKSSDVLQAQVNYFNFLNGISGDSQIEKEYVQEYDAFYTKIFDNNRSPIEVLDELYSTRPSSDSNYAYQDWVGYKSSFAHLSNQAAWFVVEKSKNPESVRKAIRWSESSLKIEKDNPYYLDTLAQLYYKNGEKEKGISTQEQALKFSGTMEEETKAELEAVLEKMKNGTY